MAILTDAGVVDAGRALCAAAGRGNEEAVKFLLRRRQQPNKTWEASGGVAYVNTHLVRKGAPLRSAINPPDGSHPRVVRLLLDAGADTTSDCQGVQQLDLLDTPLDLTIRALDVKRFKTEEEADGEGLLHLHRLEAIRRMLMSVEAIHAVSWLWPEFFFPPSSPTTARATRSGSGPRRHGQPGRAWHRCCESSGGRQEGVAPYWHRCSGTRLLAVLMPVGFGGRLQVFSEALGRRDDLPRGSLSRFHEALSRFG